MADLGSGAPGTKQTAARCKRTAVKEELLAEGYDMDPNTGRIISGTDLSALRVNDPAEAAKFTVQLDGPAEDIEKIAGAVRSAHAARTREANRRKNKAARRARRAAR